MGSLIRMHTPCLKLNTSKRDDVEILSLIGAVDSSTVDSLQDAIRALKLSRNSKLIIDCEGLTYINSRGIAVLMHWRKQQVHGGGKFALAGLQMKIVKTFDLLGIGHQLPQYATSEEAMDRFAEQGDN